jgi:hypothetical protein
MAGHAGNPKVARIENLVLVQHQQTSERGKPFTQNHIVLKRVVCMRNRRTNEHNAARLQTNVVVIKLVNPQQSLRDDVLR